MLSCKNYNKNIPSNNFKKINIKRPRKATTSQVSKAPMLKNTIDKINSSCLCFYYLLILQCFSHTAFYLCFSFQCLSMSFFLFHFNNPNHNSYIKPFQNIFHSHFEIEKLNNGKEVFVGLMPLLCHISITRKVISIEKQANISQFERKSLLNLNK